jgi:hypothetical protein
MPHWSTSPEAGQELEVEYDTVLQQYRDIKLSGTAREIADFRDSVLAPLATDLRAARAHWRGVGEMLAVNDPTAEGARQFGKVEHDKEGFEPKQDPQVFQDPETGKKSREAPKATGPSSRSDNGGAA